MAQWWSPLVGVLSGGILWEGAKFFYPDLKQKFKVYNDSRTAFYTGLDPILKAADELYGKIYSLSKEDFATFINPAYSLADDVNQNKVYVLYLFSQFWAQLEFIRLRSQYSSLTQYKPGKELLNFIETIESRNFRILDRSVQRVIGETLIQGASAPTFKIMTLSQFIRNYSDTSSELYGWLSKLERKLMATANKDIRQRFLIFGVILVSLIDHFDPKNKIIHPHTVYKNKLNEKSRKVLRKELFGHYLSFVRNKKKYS